MTKVLFLHGLESKPGGTKPKFLEKHGYKVFNPHLPKYSFEESVAIAQGVIDREMPDVVIGSSRGGAVAMCIDPGEAKLVLVAPAWSHFRQTAGNVVQESTVILHSKLDDTVKYDDSLHLSSTCGATLITVGDCHRMSDDNALEGLLDAVKWATKK